ncbi:hypothetical protein AB4254_09050 [Vibrio breoganii]
MSQWELIDKFFLRSGNHLSVSVLGDDVDGYGRPKMMMFSTDHFCVTVRGADYARVIELDGSKVLIDGGCTFVNAMVDFKDTDERAQFIAVCSARGLPYAYDDLNVYNSTMKAFWVHPLESYVIGESAGGLVRLKGSDGVRFVETKDVHLYYFDQGSDVAVVTELDMGRLVVKASGASDTPIECWCSFELIGLRVMH